MKFFLVPLRSVNRNYVWPGHGAMISNCRTNCGQRMFTKCFHLRPQRPQVRSKLGEGLSGRELLVAHKPKQQMCCPNMAMIEPVRFLGRICERTPCMFA